MYIFQTTSLYFFTPYRNFGYHNRKSQHPWKAIFVGSAGFAIASARLPRGRFS